MADSFSKKEKEKKKAQKKKEKQARKEARKEEVVDGNSLDAMIAYVDENGVIVDTPPDEQKKSKAIKAENIEISIPKKEASTEEDYVSEGRVAYFNMDKGYGFIKEKGSDESCFVHINNCEEPISEHDLVTFKKESGPKGMVAVNVKRVWFVVGF